MVAQNWIGANSRFGIGREQRDVAYPPPAVAPYAMEFIGITHKGFTMPDAKVEWGDYRVATTNHGRESFRRWPKKITRPGTLPFVPVNPRFLYYPTGKYTFKAGTGPHGKNQHIFEVQNGGSLPSFTAGFFLQGTVPFQRRFRGCVVQSQQLNIREGAELEASWQYFGGRVLDHDIDAVSGTQQLNDPTPFGSNDPLKVRPYMFYDTDADVGVAGAFDEVSYTWGFGANGRRIARVKSAQIGLQTGVRAQHFYGSGAIPRDAQEPFAYTSGNASRSLSMTIVPTAHKKNLGGARADAVYDLLNGQIKGDVILPFRRFSEGGQFIDSIDIVLLGAGIADANVERPDDGNEVTEPISFEAERILFVAENDQPDYGFPNGV
jgi:hypothetical protein